MDEVQVAFNEQLNTDLAEKATAQNTFTWDEGYYLAQYSKHTVYKSDRAEFERKDGSGSFKNVLYNIPVGMFAFKLLGKAVRMSDPITEFDAPKNYTFREAFDTVINAKGRLVQESVNGGLMTKAALANGASPATTTELLDWYANNLVVIHIGKMKEWTGNDGKLRAASNVIRSIKAYKG